MQKATPAYEAEAGGPRRADSAPAFSEADDDYDVFLFFPSQRRIYRSPASSPGWTDSELYLSTSDLSEPGYGSMDSLPSLDHLRTLPPPSSSPKGSLKTDPEAPTVFPEPEDDNARGIRKMGYSRLFRTGLRNQSCRITRRLDALTTQAVAKIRTLTSRVMCMGTRAA